MTLLLLLLLQDDSIEKLAKGVAAKDEASKKKLVAMGSRAIRPLLAERSKFADAELARVEEFITELKKSSDPVADHAAIYEKLSTIRLTVDLQTTPLQEGLGFLNELSAVPFVIDPALRAKLADRAITCKLADVPLWVALDAFSRSLDAEWAVRYGVVVISTPERLWAEASKPAKKLTEKEEAAVASLLKKLGADSLDERDKASAGLREIGPSAKDLVATAAEREKDAEVVARCKDLLRAWSDANGAVLAERCGMDLQKLAGGDLKLAEKLRQTDVTIKVKDLGLDGALKLLLASHEVEVDASAARGVRVDLELMNLSLYAALALATRSFGFDFAVKDGKIVISPQDK
jgi:hypothetical protein